MFEMRGPFDSVVVDNFRIQWPRHYDAVKAFMAQKGLSWRDFTGDGEGPDVIVFEKSVRLVPDAPASPFRGQIFEVDLPGKHG